MDAGVAVPGLMLALGALAVGPGPFALIRGENVPGALSDIHQVRVQVAFVRRFHENAVELQSWAEQRLKQRGVEVATADRDVPILIFRAWVTDDCTYVIDSWLVEAAKLSRSIRGKEPTVEAITWVGDGRFGNASGSDCWQLVSHDVRDIVNESADELIKGGAFKNDPTKKEGAP